MIWDEYSDSLCLDLDCFGAESEVCAIVCEAGTCGVNILCPQLVSEVFLQFELEGAQDSVYRDKRKTRRCEYMCSDGGWVRRVCVVRTGDHNIASRSASLATNGLRLGSSIWLTAHTEQGHSNPHTPHAHIHTVHAQCRIHCTLWPCEVKVMYFHV